MPDTILNTQRIYVKNSSFETVDALQLFQEQKPLQNSIEMHINHTSLKEKDLYEVTLSLQVTTKVEDETAYISRVEQAGIFKIEEATKEQIEQIASIHCSHLLYPYACNVLSQLVVSGSFPAIVFQPVNFGNLYRQSKKMESEQTVSTDKTVH